MNSTCVVDASGDDNCDDEEDGDDPDDNHRLVGFSSTVIVSGYWPVTQR